MTLLTEVDGIRNLLAIVPQALLDILLHKYDPICDSHIHRLAFSPLS